MSAHPCGCTGSANRCRDEGKPAAEDWKRSRGVLLGDEPKKYQELKSELAAAEALAEMAMATNGGMISAAVERDAALARVAYVEEQDQKLVGKFHEAVDRTNAAEARVAALTEALRELMYAIDVGIDVGPSEWDAAVAHARRCLEESK